MIGNFARTVVGAGLRAAPGMGRNMVRGIGQEAMGQAMGVDSNRTTGRPTVGGMLGGLAFNQAQSSFMPPAFSSNLQSGRKF